jgi:cytochrome P450
LDVVKPPAPRPLPVVGNLLAFRVDRLGFLTRLARQHGDVAMFRIGPYRLWQLAHPDHVRDALITHAGRFHKGPVLQRARLVLGQGLLTAEGDTHRRDRRLLQPAFHPRRVERYAAVMVARAVETADRWEPGRPVDVHAETVRITLAVAGATLLGTDVETDVDVVESAIADLLSAYRLAFVPFGWRLQRLPVGPMRRLQRGRGVLHRLVERMIAERRADGGDNGDLLSALVLGNAEDRLSDDEVRDQAVTLLLAGHETTANVLAFAFHLLGSDPVLEARVHSEVDDVVGDRLPEAGDAEQLPTCRGVFAEALRLFPPSWAMGRQVVEDHPVGGYVVPPGDLVLLPQWVVHRDPRWWPEPERCDPGRWTEGAARQRPRWAFFPFGGGVRRCIGESFAWTEGVLALATIARRWQLRPVPDRPLRLEPLITLRPRDGLWMRPHLRGARCTPGTSQPAGPWT